MTVGSGVLLVMFQCVCALCGMLGMLGALQALPGVEVLTSAITRSAGSLLEFSVMVVVILPLAGMILYNASIADERLALPVHLSSFMIVSTFTGVEPASLLCLAACLAVHVTSSAQARIWFHCSRVHVQRPWSVCRGLHICFSGSQPAQV